MEAVGDAPAGLLEQDVLTPRPLPAPARWSAAPVDNAHPRARPEVGLGRPQVVPVGLRLDAEPLDGDQLALDAEQLLDHALGLLVPAFTEVVIADDAVAVDEVQRRPVVVVEGAPDLVVVVERDRIVDPSLRDRLPHPVERRARTRTPACARR